jgi:putative Mg2+ transporter-C (MgtC) family protein
MTGFAFITTTGDSGRVAAQIVTGIGFLGAGVIMHGRGTISGTTTAATIWVSAALGMTAAAGYPVAALAASALARAILYTVQRLEFHHLGGIVATQATIFYSPDGGKTRVRIQRILVDYESTSIVQQWDTVEQERMKVTLLMRLPKHHLRELLADLADIPQVLAIEQPA